MLSGIWQRNWFTNNGPLVKELELKLNEFLGLNQMLYVGNGTIAIQLALKALGITKNVITTPFSYVATTSSIVWEGCKPVYVDIDPLTLNIDPGKIEEAIDANTEAILATHCFGNPCDIDAIQVIAQKYGLKVIYDAAHCFGTSYKGKSVFLFGDVSTCSFHATKLFHTVEGGAVISNESDLNRRMSFMRNFGHDGPESFNGVGINGKNSEFHAAMGLVNLNHINDILLRREVQSSLYTNILDWRFLKRQVITSDTKYNFSYYPIIFETEVDLLRVMDKLNVNEIYPRRYFHPSLSSLSYVNGETPVSDSIAKRILCLPLYHDLGEDSQRLIANIINTTLQKVD